MFHAQLSPSEADFVDALALGATPCPAAVHAGLTPPMASVLLRRVSVKQAIHNRLEHMRRIARRAEAGPRPYRRQRIVAGE